MEQLTLFEKIKLFFDLILASPFFIFLLIFIILIFILLLDSKKYKKNQIKKYIMGIYVLVFVSVIVKYHTSFFSILDYLINNVFVIFYFPNIAVYATMIIITNILMLRSIFSHKVEIIRTLNLAIYSIIMYLMLLIIYTITTENLDVYNELSLYTNQNVLVLVELSNILFIIWIVLLFKNKILSFVEIKTNKKINQNNQTEIKIVEKVVIKEVPIEVEKKIYREKEDMFTKEEYIVMLDILKNKYKEDSK